VASIDQALRIAANTLLDFVLTDSCLVDGSAADLAAVLHYRGIEPQFLVLTGDEPDQILLDLAHGGLQNLLPKAEATAERIREAIYLVGAGETVSSAATLARLLRLQKPPGAYEGLPKDGSDIHPADQLTSREREVLMLMCQGVDNQSMARRLQVNYSTVRSHVHHILEKLDAHSQLEAVARAAEYHLQRFPSQPRLEVAV
jgi:DNA-binding NarL/FixJ family response regulator